MRRQTFVQQDMFDFHFSPGYYEDTDLAFTMRALGLRVLYQPFAHVFHESHTTYAGSMDALIERNRQHFISKWSAQLRHHMPPCEVAAACRQKVERALGKCWAMLSKGSSPAANAGAAVAQKWRARTSVRHVGIEFAAKCA